MNLTDLPLSDAINELMKRRKELRYWIAGYLKSLDPSDHGTLQFAILAMLEAHFKPKELATLLGASQTTIGRWAIGQTIPRSPAYRRWVINTVLDHLQQLEGRNPISGGEQLASVLPQPDMAQSVLPTAKLS